MAWCGEFVPMKPNWCVLSEAGMGRRRPSSWFWTLTWRPSERKVYFGGVDVAFKYKDRDKIVCIAVCRLRAEWHRCNIVHLFSVTFVLSGAPVEIL